MQSKSIGADSLFSCTSTCKKKQFVDQRSRQTTATDMPTRYLCLQFFNSLYKSESCPIFLTPISTSLDSSVISCSASPSMSSSRTTGSVQLCSLVPQACSDCANPPIKQAVTTSSHPTVLSQIAVSFTDQDRKSKEMSMQGYG